MKVKCKHVEGVHSHITEGKVYIVERESLDYYHIVDDRGEVSNWSKSRFDIVETKLELKMQKYIVKDGWDVEQSNETANLDDAKAFARMQSKGDETLFIYEVKGDCLFVFVDGVEFGRN